MNLFNFLILAIISESTWETLKMVWQKGKLCVDRVGALVIAFVVIFATGFDIIQEVGIPIKIPFVGTILTAVLISRGSNFIHDFLNKLSDPKKVKKKTKTVKKVKKD